MRDWIWPFLMDIVSIFINSKCNDHWNNDLFNDWKSLKLFYRGFQCDLNLNGQIVKLKTYKTLWFIHHFFVPLSLSICIHYTHIHIQYNDNYMMIYSLYYGIYIWLLQGKNVDLVLFASLVWCEKRGILLNLTLNNVNEKSWLNQNVNIYHHVYCWL